MVQINSVLGKLGMSSLPSLLAAYAAAGHDVCGAIDGGAGAGAITKEILENSLGKVHAFEPFPGNHPFYQEHDRVILHKAALAREESIGKLYVSSTVSSESAWGQRGMAGYSSMGYLVDEYKRLNVQEVAQEKLFDVPCVAADHVIAPDQSIDLVKLDLQGGELNALRGMERITSRAKFLWVEYAGQKDLAPYLVDRGFVLFDTEYFFIGSTEEAISERFRISKQNYTLSTGASACFAFSSEPSRGDYESWFATAKRDLKMIQTDLVCVHRDRLGEFLHVLGYLPVNNAKTETK